MQNLVAIVNAKPLEKIAICDKPPADPKLLQEICKAM